MKLENNFRIGDTVVCISIGTDDDDHTWYDAEDFKLVEKPTLFDEYLKSGMVVELRNNEKYLVVDDYLMSHLKGISINQYDKLLLNKFNTERDIVKVYKRNFNYLSGVFANSFPIWEREEPVKEVTMEELEKHFGCKVKVVKE